MQRSLLPDIGSSTMPSGTAFRQYVRATNGDTLRGVGWTERRTPTSRLAHRGQMRHHRRPSAHDAPDPEDVSPWVHGSVV
jgi:hypothetical protein